MVNLNCIAQDFIKQWAYIESLDGKYLTTDLVELWEYYIQNPINLNDPTQLYQLGELNLLSEKELKLITLHCEAKELISIYQLQVIDVHMDALKRIKTSYTYQLSIHLLFTQVEQMDFLEFSFKFHNEMEQSIIRLSEVQ